MVSWDSRTGCERNWNRVVHYSQVLKEVPYTPWEATRSRTDSVDRERQDLTHITLWGSIGTVLWGPWAKAGLVRSIQRSRVWVNFVAILSKEHVRGRHWETEEALGESSQELASHWAGCCLKHSLAGGPWRFSLRSCRLPGQTKWMRRE